MKKAWIVLANSTVANIYGISEREPHLKLIKQLSHSESKLKKSDLTSDRPGHYQKGHNHIRGAYAEPVDHKELEAEHFAKQVIEVLEEGRVAAPAAYQGLIIIAGTHFYGLLNKQANQHIKDSIKYHLPKDYTHLSEKELKTELEPKLAHEIRLLLMP